jgi:GAF domain-containing protein
MSWDKGMPVFLEDLGKASSFLRADSAVKVGINRGFAVPCPAGRGEMYVLAFLSALATPIARRVEVWERLDGGEAGLVSDASAGPQLRRISGFCEALGSLAASAQTPLLEFGQGTIGQVLLTGVPGISNQADSEPVGLGAAAREAGLKSLAAIPVIRDGRTVACVALYF